MSNDETMRANEHQSQTIDNWLHGEPTDSLNYRPTQPVGWSNTAIVAACSVLQLHQRKDVANVLGVIDYIVETSRKTGVPFDDVVDAVLDVHVQEEKWKRAIRKKRAIRRYKTSIIGKYVTVYWNRIKFVAQKVVKIVLQPFVDFVETLVYCVQTIYKVMHAKLKKEYDLFIRATTASNDTDVKPIAIGDSLVERAICDPEEVSNPVQLIPGTREYTIDAAERAANDVEPRNVLHEE